MDHGTSETTLGPIDHASAVPFHRQIEEQTRFAIAGGRLSPGQRLPTVRDLARSLGVHANTAARAYAALAREGVLSSRHGGGTFVSQADAAPYLREEREARLGAIVARALVQAASLGFSPQETEAAVALHVARWREDRRPPRGAETSRSARRGTLTLMGSHDLALDLLVGQMRGRLGVPVSSTHVGSLGGLIALARGEADVAGCHLLDEESGEYNLPFVRRVLAGVPCVVVTLAGRQQGFLTPRGNPKRIRGVDDLARADVRVIRRQRGSGTRVLMDCLLRRAGLDPGSVGGERPEADTHLAVAAAVVSGQADVGLGILAAARAMGLDFLPLHQERYDLVVPRGHWESRAVRGLRRILASAEFKASVGELGGYDTALSGAVVAEVAG